MTTDLTIDDLTRLLPWTAGTIGHWSRTGRFPAPYRRVNDQPRGRGCRRIWSADDVLDWLDERSCPHCRELRRARDRLRR